MSLILIRNWKSVFVLVFVFPGLLDSLEAQEKSVIRGRCVAAETGEPLEGCRVEFGGWPKNSGAVAAHGKVDWEDPDPVFTDAKGVFRIEFVPPKPYQFHLDIDLDGRAPRTARWSFEPPEPKTNLGDIELSLGYRVRGKVIDSAGKPVPRVGVRLRDLPLPLSKDMGANSMRSGFSGNDGSFVIAADIPSGTWLLDISHGRGTVLVGPNKVTVDAGDKEIKVLVRAMPSIRGQVVDESGQGVQGVRLQAKLGRSGKMASGRTNAFGNFVIHRIKDCPDEVRLVISDPGPCQPALFDELHRWGEEGIVLKLKLAKSFELTVLEAGSKKPIEEYAIRCHSATATNSRETSIRLGGDHEDGKLQVDKVIEGDCSLMVIPRDPQYRITTPVTFAVGEDPIKARDVMVEKMKRYQFIIVDADEAPVANRLVRIIDHGGAPIAKSPMVDDPRSQSGSVSFSSGPLPLAISRGVTDAEGKVHLFLPENLEGLSFDLSDPNQVFSNPSFHGELAPYVDPEFEEVLIELSN